MKGIISENRQDQEPGILRCFPSIREQYISKQAGICRPAGDKLGFLDRFIPCG
jgi:hypothetical protein